MFVSREHNAYRIEFRFANYLLEAVKALPQRRYDPNQKNWLVPLECEADVKEFMRKYRFQWKPQGQPKEQQYENPPMPELTQAIPLDREPYPYQKQGIAYALRQKKCIMGDKPGLGKTGQAIAAVVGAKAFPCLIICPSSLKINWQREVDIWTGGRHRAVILGDDNRKTWHTFHDCGAIDMFGQNSKVDFFIVNYESLSKFFVSNIKKRIGKDGKDAPLRVTDIEFLPCKDMFRSIVIDESHRCKNGATKQSKFCMGICKGKEYVYLLTGTPVVNKPKDLVAQLHIMDTLPLFGGYKAFIDRYCSGTKEASNLSELNYRLRTMCFYQREKKDVLKDLPSKIRQTVICEINTRREYLAAEDNLIDYLRKYRDASDEKIARALKGQAMVLIGILRQISAKGKIDAVKEFTDNLVQSGEKVILFVSLHEIVDALKHIYPKAVTVTGRDDMDSRQRAVDNFQRDPKCNIIICSIKAAGTGLTLTASSNVGFVEFPWTYADCEQCEDRAHRIGQLSSVTASYFLGKNTIDEKVYQIIQTKKDIANAATGVTEEIEEATIDMITNLFSSRL